MIADRFGVLDDRPPRPRPLEFPMKKKTSLRKLDQGSRRAAHFAAGGTPAMWRGRAATLDEGSSKARQHRLACRGRVRLDAQGEAP